MAVAISSSVSLDSDSASFNGISLESGTGRCGVVSAMVVDGDQDDERRLHGIWKMNAENQVLAQ